MERLKRAFAASAGNNGSAKATPSPARRGEPGCGNDAPARQSEEPKKKIAAWEWRARFLPQSPQ